MTRKAYVISGDLTFETLTLSAGDYHVARHDASGRRVAWRLFATDNG